MLLFNQHAYQCEHADEKSRQLVEKTSTFFEKKGLQQIKADDSLV